MEDTDEYKPKEIKISSSSVVELKAELSKREAEYLKSKHSAPTTTTRITKLKNMILPKDRNKGITKRLQKDLEDQGELAQIEASWVALQRKAKQYEQMKRDGVDADEDENVLVDFALKEDEPQKLKKPSLLDSNLENGDWVEIVDEFGRNRLVRQEEAERIQAVKPQQPHVQSGMMSADMIREKERQEWEEAVKNEQLNKHFDAKWERRALGVGYYQLSQDMDSRRQQMQELKDLRVDTIISRTRAERIKLLRHEKLEARRRVLEERARKRRNGIDPSVEKAKEFLKALF